MSEEKPRSFDGVDPVVPADHENERIERLRRAMYSRSLSPNIKDKPRRALDTSEANVGEEWIHEEPRLPQSVIAPRTIGFARSALRWMLGAAFMFFLGALGFFGYFFFFGGGSTPASPGNIDILISGPLQVQSGEPTELQIAVVNKNRAALELADLVIEYPKGTRSPTDLSTDLPSQRTPLGTIAPGGRRQGTVSAVFSGIEGDRGVIKVELEYRLQNSSAIFVAKTEYHVTFATSPLTISVEGNDETISGQPVEFIVTVASNADAPVKDVLLSATMPFGFILQSTDPEPLSGAQGKLFALGDLSPGQKKTVTLRGTLNGESGDERVFRFITGTRTVESDKEIAATLAEYAHHLTVSRPFLGLSIAINRDEGGQASVAPDDVVNVTISWQNNLSTMIRDSVIVARLSGIEIDGATVRSTDGFYRSNDRVVLWDKTTSPTLGSIASGARGSVSFSFKMPASEELKDVRDPRITISVNAAGKRESETGVPESLHASSVETVRLASDLQLIAQGLYYGNPLGSSGPMPPKAGTETTYGIVFSITNTTNEIQSTKVKALLPPYVRWVGVYAPSSAKLSFNQQDSTFTWDVGTVGPGVGVNGTAPKQVAIVVGLTPSTSQIGQQPSLIRNIQLIGTDASTGQSVVRAAQDVTTNIVGDSGFSPANATIVR